MDVGTSQDCFYCNGKYWIGQCSVSKNLILRLWTDYEDNQERATTDKLISLATDRHEASANSTEHIQQCKILQVCRLVNSPVDPETFLVIPGSKRGTSDETSKKFKKKTSLQKDFRTL
eukprot:1983799-Amphidinium_carterae.1